MGFSTETWGHEQRDAFFIFFGLGVFCTGNGPWDMCRFFFLRDVAMTLWRALLITGGDLVQDIIDYKLTIWDLEGSDIDLPLHLKVCTNDIFLYSSYL